jgi:hypothetical protein
MLKLTFDISFLYVNTCIYYYLSEVGCKLDAPLDVAVTGTCITRDGNGFRNRDYFGKQFSH